LSADYTPLYRALGYQFNKPEWLTAALTHRSVGTANNERLEFLGDALLSFIVAETLFERFTNASEGELTRCRASLVKKDTLAEIAQDLKLGNYLHLGGGELKSGGYRRASILADALEAVLGAIFLDAGLDACRQVILHLLTDRLIKLSPKHIDKDAKTRLQEYLQAKQLPLPEYRVLAIEGAPHEQRFEVECVVQILDTPSYGLGESRRRAEQEAATQALIALKIEHE
jgi:ribonuclease-3